MIVQKAKGYPIKEKYQKSFSQWDVIVPKRSNVMTEKKELNVKFQVMLSSLGGGHICILLYLRWVTWSSANCVCLSWIDHWIFTLD